MQWTRKIVVVSVCAAGLAAPAAAESVAETTPQVEYSRVPDSLIDIVIKWIEEWFDPEPEEETPPAEEESW